MEYKSNKRSNRLSSTGTHRSSNKFKRSASALGSSGSKSKSSSYSVVKFLNSSRGQTATTTAAMGIAVPATSSPNILSGSKATESSSTQSFGANWEYHLARDYSMSSSSSRADQLANANKRTATVTASSLLTPEALDNEFMNHYDNNNINYSSTISSQYKLDRKNNNNKYSRSNLSNQESSNSSSIATRSNHPISPAYSNGKKRKRSAAYSDEKDLLEPESKRSAAHMYSVVDTASSSFYPIASTSGVPSLLRASNTPISYRSDIPSVPSSVESSSFHSSSSPPSMGAEIDEFIERDIKGKSSASAYLSADSEFDFVPSSDESTLIAIDRHAHSRLNDDEQHQIEAERIQQHFTTPNKARVLTPSLDMRHCPLPALSWANAPDVWNSMCKNDEKAASVRTSAMLDNHCGLQSRMRAILLDWLIEVCEVYKLHRETYYLAVDYLDRYLSTQKNVQKTHLQLIGITCLFVAAKVEEIYPPKIGEFAYVTDGACQDEDILQHELLLLSALDWSITPITIMGWLGVYMQLNVNNRSASTFVGNSCSGLRKDPSILITKQSKSQITKRNQEKESAYIKDNNNVDCKNNNYFSTDKVPSGKSNCSNDSNSSNAGSRTGSICENDSGISIGSADIDETFIYPQFSGYEFSQTAQLIDLCTLDLGLADFPYSVIAAAAMSHTFGRETAVRVSGYEWSSLAKCVKWMEPFFEIIKDEAQFFYLTEQNEQIQSKHGLGHICPKIITDDSHMIQVHTISITMLEKALLRREQMSTLHQPEVSPAIKTSKHQCPEGLLTPPASNRKPQVDEVRKGEIDFQRMKT